MTDEPQRCLDCGELMCECECESELIPLDTAKEVKKMSDKKCVVCLYPQNNGIVKSGNFVCRDCILYIKDVKI